MSERATLEVSDQELVARSQRGDQAAFGQIYTRYERAVYRYVYHMIGDPDEAEDIKQDCFVKAHRTLPGFRGDCSLLTWLLKVAGNLCRDRIKSRVRRGEMALLPELEATLPDDRPQGADPAQILQRKYMASARASGAGRTAGSAARPDRPARFAGAELSADRRRAGLFGIERETAPVPGQTRLQRAYGLAASGGIAPLFQ